DYEPPSRKQHPLNGKKGRTTFCGPPFGHPVISRGALHRAVASILVVNDHGAALLAKEQRRVVWAKSTLARRTGSLPAAKRLAAGPGTGRRATLPVGVHDASLDTVEELLDLVLVLREDTGGQPILDVVRLRDRVLERINLPDSNERHEVLALERFVIEWQVTDDGRGDEGALRQLTLRQALSAKQDRATGVLHLLDCLLEPLHRALVDHGTNEDILVGRVADLQLTGALHQPLDKLVVDLRLDVGAGAGRALLPGETERRARDTLDRLVHIGVLGHDRRVLATHLGNDRLRIDRAEGVVELHSGLLGPGKDDAVRHWVMDEVVADFLTATGDELQRPGRKTAVKDRPGKEIAGQRRRGRRLEHDRVAGHERATDRASSQRMREVERCHDPEYAKRPQHGDVPLARVLAPHLLTVVVVVLFDVGVVVEQVSALLDLADRLRA